MKTFKVAAILAVMALAVASAGADVFTTAGSGDWGNDATWAGTGVPGTGDTIQFGGNHTITVEADTVFSGGSWWDTGKVNIATGQTLQLEVGGTFSISNDGKRETKGDSGIWDIDGTLVLGNFSGLSGTFELQNDGAHRFDVSGIVELRGTGGQTEFRMQGGDFFNDGVVLKTGSYDGLFGHTGSAIFDNNGTIRVEEGELLLDDNSIDYTDSGSWEFVVDNTGEAALFHSNTDSVLDGDIDISIFDEDGGSFGQAEYLVARLRNLTPGGYGFLEGTNVASIRTEADGSDTLVYATPIPEPATMSLLALGGLGVLLKRKR